MQQGHGATAKRRRGKNHSTQCRHGHSLQDPAARSADGRCRECERLRAQRNRDQQFVDERVGHHTTCDDCEQAMPPRRLNICNACLSARRKTESAHAMAAHRVESILVSRQLLEDAPAWVRAASPEEQRRWVDEELRARR